MLPRVKDYARAARSVETALGQPPAGIDGVIESFLAAAGEVLGH